MKLFSSTLRKILLSLLICGISGFVGDDSLFAQETQEGWQFLETSDELPHYRHENAYAEASGKFYLIGGRGERPVDIYDPESKQWTTGVTPPLSMHHFQAVTYDGKIYVIGAFTGGFPDEDPISNMYIYHPEQDQWEKGPLIPEERQRGAAGAVVHQDKIYLVGGIQNGHIDGHVRFFDVFDPSTGEWAKLPDLPRNRDHFQVAVIDDKLYAVGGRRTSQATERLFELTIPEVDVFDFDTQKWKPLSPAADLPTERAGSTTITADGKLIVLGGESGNQEPAHNEVELFDPKTKEWKSLPPMQEGRHGTQGIIYEGKIYIAAGSKTRGATEVNSHEVLDLRE